MRLLIIGIFSLMTLTLFSQDLMTIKEVFDFEINDEFHYIGDFEASPITPPNAQRYKIIDKYYSENSDTIFYKLLDFSYYTSVNQDYTLEYHFRNDTINKFYTNLDSSLIYFDSNFQYDTIVEYFNCGSIVNGYMYVEGDFEPTTISKKYGLGLGLTYDYVSEGGGMYNPYSKTLFYYKKGDTSCGEPDLLSNINDNSIEDIIVFPNPVVKDFSVKNVYFNINIIIIYDISGVVLKTETNKDVIDISDFSNGIYIVEIITEKRKNDKKDIENVIPTR